MCLRKRKVWLLNRLLITYIKVVVDLSLFVNMVACNDNQNDSGEALQIIIKQINVKPKQEMIYRNNFTTNTKRTFFFALVSFCNILNKYIKKFGACRSIR